MRMTLTSTAFAPGGAIPSRYPCEGRDVSPPLAWSGLPQGTRSLALVVDDPGAPDPAHPKMTYVHWVLYNLPPWAAGLLPDLGTPTKAALEAAMAGHVFAQTELMGTYQKSNAAT